jgi:DNA-directed RNA polymerase specialized sigma24 family protein
VQTESVSGAARSPLIARPSTVAVPAKRGRDRNPFLRAVSDRGFRPLPSSEIELRDRSDEDLIAYVRIARTHGDRDGADLALRVLVFGYMDHVSARVALKVPSHAVDEVAGQALISAVTSAFRGESVGEFRSWLHVIVDRRIADFHRAGRVEVVPLLPDHDALASLDDTGGEIAARNVVDAAMAELSEPHRAAVDLYVFDGLSAHETALELAQRFASPANARISADNVHKIAQRFRDRVRASLQEAGE